MWKQAYFWFSPPSSFLINYDNYLAYFFAGLFVLGVILKIAQRFLMHKTYNNLVGKFSNLGVWLGLSGLAWFALRYENTPVFSQRYWPGLIILSAIIWLGFIVKYLFTKFRTEKKEFEKSVVNARYIPNAK